MSLKFNIRHLQEHDLHFKGELAVADLDLGTFDDMIQLNQPLRYDLNIQDLPDSILVTGKLAIKLDCECVRCLKKFKLDLKLSSWALHLPTEGEDKVSIDNDCVDLTPFVREDMLLEFPQHPVCKPECEGLIKKTKANATDGGEKLKSAVWSELDKLKL